MSFGLEDWPGVDGELAAEIRRDIANAKERLDQSIINYRFGMQVIDGVRDVTDDLFIASMAMMLTDVFDTRRAGDRQLPLMFAILIVNEMRRNDK